MAAAGMLSRGERSRMVRSRRARTRAEVARMSSAEGRAAVADLLVEMPGWLETVRAHELLAWPAGVTETRAWALLAQVGSHEFKHAAALTVRQRHALAGMLRAAHDGRWGWRTGAFDREEML